MVKALQIFNEHLSKIQGEHERIFYTLEFCLEYQDFLQEECYMLAQKALQQSRDIEYSEGEAYALLSIATYLSQHGKHKEAEEEIQKATLVASKGNSNVINAMMLQYTSFLYWVKGQLDVGLNMAFEALKLAETTNNLKCIGWCNYVLGVFYFDLKDLESSLKYFTKALNTEPDPTKEIYGKARCHSGIGSIYIKQEQYEKALDCIEKSRKVYEELEHGTGKSRAYNDMGVVFQKLRKYTEAEQYLSKSLAIRKETNYVQGIITTEMELGRLYIEMQQYNKALEHLTEALMLAEETATRSKIYQSHELLGNLYKQLNDPWKALEHTEKFFQVRSEVLGLEATNKISQIETHFAKEKSEKEAELYRLRHVELKAAYDEIEEKNRDISASIQYARRIQHAILPSTDLIYKALAQSFILYKPKDVVSGDFYAFAQKDDHVLIAAADCTGHGVPGALMSMIGSNLLNQAIAEKKLRNPAQILDFLNEGIIKTLKQNETETRDGMDIALCSISLSEKVVKYAGANRPLWVLRKDGLFEEVKPDKQPIGGGLHVNHVPFTNQSIKIELGDTLYLSTDGYADQFGGQEGKKMMTKRFKETLTNIQHLSMPEQETFLNNVFEGWKGKHEQVDDVLVIGVRV